MRFGTEVLRRGLARRALAGGRLSAGCSRASCLNTSSKVLSCGFVSSVPPFISLGGGGQIAICWRAAPGRLRSAAAGAPPGSVGQEGAAERPRALPYKLSAPCPAEQPWR